MLYFIFTIDGDWDEYFNIDLPESERLPKKGLLKNLVQHEIQMADRLLKSKYMHFIHTSPRARDFFIEEPFLKLWQEIINRGGDVGLHCHEDDPYKDYYYQDISLMRDIVSERICAFQDAGLSVKCYRGGFLGFSYGMVEILEENKIYFDFSCEPGRFLTYKGGLISDWRGAPENFYRMSYDNHCKRGNSNVWEIPIGSSNGKHLYFERASLSQLRQIVSDLKEKSIGTKSDIIVSVLTHTYEYASLEKREDIKRKIGILKNCGSFINIKELEDIVDYGKMAGDSLS